MRLIDADVLYESTAEWEASAFAKIEELNRTPLEEMDDVEKALWRKWTAILNERTAFKQDVFDAPTIESCKYWDSESSFCALSKPSAQPEPKWIPVTERLPKENGDYLVTGRKGAVNKRKYEDGRWYGNWAIVAWMPLPEPWKGGDES